MEKNKAAQLLQKLSHASQVKKAGGMKKFKERMIAQGAKGAENRKRDKNGRFLKKAVRNSK
jgi:ribosomal protein L17